MTGLSFCLTSLTTINHADMGAGSATVKSQVVAKATGLEHTIRISLGVNQPYAIFDSLM